MGDAVESGKPSPVKGSGRSILWICLGMAYIYSCFVIVARGVGGRIRRRLCRTLPYT